MRRFCCALFLLLIPAAADAGDAAARNVIGFSADGKFFAFEQYTMEYEEEASFSEYFFIDTVRDAYLPGTPVLVRITGDDGLDEKKARADAAVKASVLVQKHRINDRGQHLSGKPSMDLDDGGIYQMRQESMATMQEFSLPDGRKAELAIATRPLGKAKCKSGRGVESEFEVKGLILTLTVAGSKMTLQDDRKLPRARRCVTAYGIAEAWLHTAAGKAITIAVIVETEDNHDSHAGPNRRFMAVTKRLPPAK
jgi:predicted secreted protein